MSRFASERLRRLTPYVPGEQPRDKKYIKLNTNENPYYVSGRAVDAITESSIKNLKLYSDPECAVLVKAIAEFYGTDEDEVMATNGSDEALAFCFAAYGGNGVVFADVTYGFYGVLAALCGCPVKTVPLRRDFTIDPADYFDAGCTVVIANPNAQIGIGLSVEKLESIIANNVDNIVIIDQAYADFSGVDAIPLVKKYDNLVVVNTFSKSRSLAGARVGYIVAQRELIADIKLVKNSFHPYNVNTLSMLLAAEAIKDVEYFNGTVSRVIASRKLLTQQLRNLKFDVLPSDANFVAAKHCGIGGRELYEKLKKKGVLVRHFSEPRICDYIRITVGTEDEIAFLIKKLKEILAENEKCKD